MGTELSLRIWSDLAPSVLWDRLITGIGKWDAIDGAWQGLRIVDDHLQARSALRGAVSADDIKGRVTPAGQPDRCFKTGIAFRCWRNAHGKPITGHQRLGIDVWGPAWRPERDRRIEGQACLRIPDVGPYLPGRNTGHSEWNVRAEQNNEALTQLFFAVIDAVSPTKMTLASEAGLPIPVNLHAVWHQDRAGFLADIATLYDVAERGLPAYRLSPLLGDPIPDDALALHEWRTPEARRLVWQRLQQAHASGYHPTVADVDRVLASGPYYFHGHRGGVLLVEYPFLLDGFVDRFFLNVMVR